MVRIVDPLPRSFLKRKLLIRCRCFSIVSIPGNGAKYERDLMDLLRGAGYLVTRSAGSHSVDLTVTNRYGHTMVLEVKSFDGDTFSVRKKAETVEQWEEMLAISKDFRTVTVRYALRPKGLKSTADPWRFIGPERLGKPYHWDTPQLNIMRAASDGAINQVVSPTE